MKTQNAICGGGTSLTEIESEKFGVTVGAQGKEKGTLLMC